MSDLDTIQTVVGSAGFSLAGRIVINPSHERSFFVPLKVERDDQRRQARTPRTLAWVRRELNDRGIRIEIISVDQSTDELERRLRERLKDALPQVIRNAFLTLDRSSPIAWIDNLRPMDDAERRIVEEQLEQFQTWFQLSPLTVSFMSEVALPTRTELLAAIRLLAPATCEDVRDALLSRDLAVPSLEWVNHQFDALRKLELIVRLQDRRYALSAMALHKLGTVKGRRSPDVGRLLALARRQR